MKKYKDKAFLQEQYVNLGKPAIQIAREIGCGRKTVSKWIKEFNLSRYPAGNEEWLRQQYLDQGRSTYQIAEEKGCDPVTVGNWLKKFDIPLRHSHQSINHVKVSDSLLEYLDGSLLGDGNLRSQSPESACYRLTQKHLSYIQYARGYLEGRGLLSAGQIQTRTKKQPSGNITFAYYYATRAYRELKEQYNRWYPSSKKRVPADVKLTPLSIRTWFLEDGTWYNYRGYKGGEVHLYAYAFKGKGLNILVEKLKNILDTSRIHIDKRGVIFFGHKTAVKKFFDYILPLPEELKKDYGYKYPQKALSEVLS